MAKLKPADMGIVQCYENFTGGVLMSLVEHDLVKAEQANEFLVPENLLAPLFHFALDLLARKAVIAFEFIAERLELALHLRAQFHRPQPRPLDHLVRAFFQTRDALENILAHAAFP